jgi:hypothetical protein
MKGKRATKQGVYKKKKKKGQIWGLVLMTIERVPHGKSKLFCYWDGASEISISIICIRVYIIIIIIIIIM